MPKFGDVSKARLETCHKDIQTICNFVIKYFDFSVLEGAREDARQFSLYLDKKSKLDGVNQKSKHQVTVEEPLSYAVDVAPYPIDFSDKHKAKARFFLMAGYFFMASEILFEHGLITHKLRWGGDWDSDKTFDDQSFDDLPHMELI